MSCWNYRVIKKDCYLGIHGVYYDDSGKICNWDIDPNALQGSDLKDLRNRLELMLEALDKEVLDFESLDNNQQ